MSTVREFMEHHYLHFNSREVLAASQAYEHHLAQGGKMLISLAGAMSTARIGRILSRLIREDKVHAISCTGANLEEDVFNLLAADDYEIIPDWRALSAKDEQAFYERGMNRVTDTCIPETVMRHLEIRLLNQWQQGAAENETLMPSEYLYRVLDDESLQEHFQIPKEDSWLIAAKEKNLPVFTPGWEDSTTGNMFAAYVMKGDLPHHQCVATGTEQMQRLVSFYRESHGQTETSPAMGFFQIGGGIAGDFAICAVPLMIQDMQMEDTPFWGYFCQISDAVTSYGGYSGAPPNEKITWGKLTPDTPKFMINSDATIVAPLMFAYLLGD
jgi:deoxyhypusine synthase